MFSLGSKRAVRRSVLVLPLVAVALVAIVLVRAAPSQSSTPSKATKSVRRAALACGQTVTASVVLTADLTGCSARGLVIGANNVSINLNGHTISGSGVLQGVYDAGFGSATVTNGTITGFVRGVEFDSGTGNAATNLRIHDNSGTGIFTFVPTTISGNVIWANGSGISVGCCTTDKATIANNVVNGNSGDGIDVSFSGTGSTVSGNRVLSNTGTGINIGAAGAIVSNNTANANGSDGMDLTSNGSLPAVRATGNHAFFNTALGISFGGGDTDAGGNKASGNGTLHQCENIVCS